MRIRAGRESGQPGRVFLRGMLPPAGIRLSKSGEALRLPGGLIPRKKSMQPVEIVGYNQIQRCKMCKNYKLCYKAQEEFQKKTGNFIRIVG